MTTPTGPTDRQAEPTHAAAVSPGPGSGDGPDGGASEPRGRRPWVRAAVLVLIFAGGIAIFRWTPVADYVEPARIAGFFRDLGAPWWSPIVFVVLYAVGTALGMPGTIPTLAGGAIYGVARGTLFNIVGSNLGAFMAFLVARYLGRDFVNRVLRGRAAQLDEKIGEHGFQTILYLRLIPLIPFNALNFGAGVSRVSLRDYVLGSLIGMLPGTFVYTYFADALILGTGAARREALINFLIAAGLLVAFTLITGWVRRRTGPKPGPDADRETTADPGTGEDG